MKIVITDKIDFTNDQKSRLKHLGDVDVYDDIPKNEKDIIKRTRNANIITTNWIDITKKVIEESCNLESIVVAAVGYDKVDIKTATEMGIKVSNSPTFCVNAVAEHTFAILFSLLRKVGSSNNELKAGLWKKSDFEGSELTAKTLGIIGYGKIGKRVGEIGNAFDMRILTANSKSTQMEIDSIISASDVISLHVPQQKDTIKLIDERRLQLMKKDAYIVNTARGPIVDQNALYKTLKSRRIAGAALDVFEVEPLDGNVSDKIKKLVNLDNVVATPHIAYKTKESIFRVGEEVIESIEAAVKGKPINVVN